MGRHGHAYLRQGAATHQLWNHVAPDCLPWIVCGGVQRRRGVVSDARAAIRTFRGAVSVGDVRIAPHLSIERTSLVPFRLFAISATRSHSGCRSLGRLRRLVSDRANQCCACGTLFVADAAFPGVSAGETSLGVGDHVGDADRPLVGL